MAQPLFDDHPMEQYLRAAGEPPEIMPGSAPEFVEDHNELETELEEEEEWRPALLVWIVESLQSLFLSPQESSQFAERFKYDVISSSLLSTTLPVPHSHRRSMSPSLPGKLKLDAPPNPPHEIVDYGLLSVLFVIAAVFLAMGFYFFTVVSIGGATIYLYNHSDNSKPDMVSTIEALNELITANAMWDSVVQDTVTVLEKEEESPPSPVSAVRLSLHSSLHTTQTQCDNVRHLLSALTAPLELSQIAEMYAPPSPRHSMPPPSPDVPSHKESKRTTWNGSYSTISSTPSIHVSRNREKRRSDLSSLLNTSSLRSHSAPSTPPATSLIDVQEEEDSDARQQFGAAALDLHRRRRISGIESLRLHATPPRTPRTPFSGSSTISHASRFTTMQTLRHPLALSALYHALDGALASKRYACSHLLALRFSDQDDEGYWEDVRSVMGLLTTTFSDAAARLTAALEEAEHQDAEFNQCDTIKLADLSVDIDSVRATGGRTTASILTSFAPVPTHLTRFAAHVDAISSALDDAREHLAECVAALRDPGPSADQPHLKRRRSRTFSLARLGGEAAAAAQQPAEPPALQAYERLRRELGLALRECERGRDRLLDLVSPPAPPPDPAESEEDEVPSLGHDASDEYDESDKPEEASPHEDGQRDHAVVVAPGDGLDAGAVDDATAHLLLGASPHHLPLPGAEQVFESDAEVGLFTRERSKLTREERIQLAKARRESGGGLKLSSGPPASSDEPMELREKWGPGGEVVQELKDVIWKVGERRRKMTDGQRHSVDSG
ncbi:hypothetical protein C8F04DRAFT_1097548 [Mycena alexandri]|uniref:Uncharacterized protein n=1 Tax=Mycena alexandri TaxID=1745969 RepID=A0AAD6SXZ9_9AGAR|nr:hypothetical protein C8F04DRAFT_1097548 [Mycena alexandri]